MREYEKPNILLSGCIEHFHSRYDGSMIRDEFIEKLKNHVNFITVCPEISIGLSTPRQSLRLVLRENGEESLVFSKTGEEFTEKMVEFSKKFLDSLVKDEMDGAVLKGRSPSCGVKDVKIYKTHGKTSALSQKTKGLFADAVINMFNGLCIEDEGRLTNYNIRDNFLTNIYTHSYFRKVREKSQLKYLIEFHSNNKYLLMAHSPNGVKVLGKIVANAENKNIINILKEYEDALLSTLSIVPRTSRNINMLLHLFGYFSKYLSSTEKAFFLDELQKYSDKKIPFSVPIALINSYVMRFENDYLLNQTIFEPFPEELIQVTDSGKGI